MSRLTMFELLLRPRTFYSAW